MTLDWPPLGPEAGLQPSAMSTRVCKHYSWNSVTLSGRMSGDRDEAVVGAVSVVFSDDLSFVVDAVGSASWGTDCRVFTPTVEESVL
jgi:hypothetical protein